MESYREFGVFAAGTVDEWTAILDLAAKWNFKSIRALAIRQLGPIASSIDKIVLGRKHNIHEWLGDAYRNVCERPDPLTYEEGTRLGMGDVIKISTIRHDFGLGMTSASAFSLNEELQRCFGIDIETGPPIHDVPNAEENYPEPQAQKSVVEEREAQTVAPFPVYGYKPQNQSLIKEVACVPPPTWAPLPPLFGAASDEAKRPEELVNFVDRDDNLGLNGKPLTKVQLKKKKQQQEKEAKEKADREFQEQLEKELAEEAGYWPLQKE
jgi:hypothetical protein